MHTLFENKMNNNKFLKLRSFIKFIFFGTLITLLSNSLLLLMLLILPVILSTFISQVLHAFLGYLANKYGVFKRKGKPFTYTILVIISWLVQWILIKILNGLGFSSYLSVLIAMPFLALISFITQKYFVFKNIK